MYQTGNNITGNQIFVLIFFISVRMDISSYYEINAQFFLYVNPENIIYTNNDKDYSNYPPEPEFKYFYLIEKTPIPDTV